MQRYIPWLIFISALFIFAQQLGQHGIEYRDDEIFYFHSTQEMLKTNDYFSPTYFGENRFQKPILFYWLVLGGYQLFGDNWVGARSVAVVSAAFALVVTYGLAREFLGRSAAFLATLILATIPLFFRHAKNAVPDMTLNLFIVLALTCAWKFFQNPNQLKYRWGFFVCCALGFLIKGFAALVIPLLSVLVFALLSGRVQFLKKFNYPLGILIIILLIAPWFIYMVARHGEVYSDYVLKAETMNRLVSEAPLPWWQKFPQSFFANSTFYFKNIFSYFAPWSAFAVIAVPWAMLWGTRDPQRRDALLFHLVWMWVAFLFFSSIFTRINHLVLVLTTPFAIILATFLVESFERNSGGARILSALKKFFALLLIALGCLGFVFLRVFLAGQSWWWGVLLGAVLLLCAVVIIANRRPIVAPMCLGLFLLSCLAQYGLMSDLGLTSLSVLQRFAKAIEEQPATAKRVLGVASHDIHEKEWQVYFSEQIQKVGTEESAETEEGIRSLLNSEGTVYCLILKRDWEKFRESAFPATMEVIHEDLIFKRRIKVDDAFFVALRQMDRSRVREYFFEPIMLVKRGNS